MEKISKGLTVIKSDFVGWTYKPKIYLVVIAIMWFVHDNFRTVFEFAASMGYRVNFNLFAHMFTYPFMRTLLFCCIVFLFADAPFVTEMQLFMIGRVGKGIWYAAQTVYVIICSLLVDVLLFISPLVFRLDKIVFQNDWGKVLTSITIQPEIMNSVNGTVIRRFTPVQALLYYGAILFLLTCFIGLLMYFTNLIHMRAVGAGIMFGIIMLEWTVYMTDFHPLVWISPMSWIRPECMSYGLDHTVPSVTYAAAVLLILNILLCAGIYKASKRTDVAVTVKE